MKKYEMIYSKDGCVALFKASNMEQIFIRIKQLDILNYEVYYNFDGHFHNTTDEKYLYMWKDDTGRKYWSNVLESIKGKESLKELYKSIVSKRVGVING